MPSFRCTEWTPSAFRRNRARWKAHICRASSQGLQWRRGWRWRAASLWCAPLINRGHIAASLLSAAGGIAFRTARACVPYFGRNHRAPFVQRNVCRVPGGRQHRPLCRPGGGPHRRKTGLCVPGRGGVSILASECSEEIKPKVSVKGADCSFSGLENQCAALLERGAAPAYVAKYCLSAVGQTVLRMICAAQEQYPGVPVVCAGGVMSSDIIRAYVQRTQPDIYFVPGRYSSDNAIGVAVLAAKEVQAWPM